MPAQTVIKVRRDVAANWTSVNPTLASGEIGFETDTNQLKVGNGTLTWTALPYASGAGGASVEVSTTAPADPEEGDVWFNSTEGRAYIYYDSFWVDLNPGVAGAPGATGETGVAIQAAEPESTDVLWLDTDEEPDVPVPAGGTEGQVLAKASATDYDSEWVSLPQSSSGLEFITAVPFTGVASVSLGSDASPIFTSDYDNYKIIFTAENSTGIDRTWNMRLRANTTDLTTGYTTIGFGFDATNSVNSDIGGATSWQLVPNNNYYQSVRSITFELFGPVLEGRSRGLGMNMGGSATANAFQSFLLDNGSVDPHNGFTVTNSSGNFVNGLVSVYGFRKA